MSRYGWECPERRCGVTLTPPPDTISRMTTPDPTAPLEPTTARQHAIRHLADLVHGSGAQAVFPVIDAIADMIREQVAAAVGPIRDEMIRLRKEHATAADMEAQRVERVTEAVAALRDGLRLHVDADHAELDRRLVALEAATPTAAKLEEIDRNARAYGFEVGRGRPLNEQIASLAADNPFLNRDWRNAVPAPTDQALPRNISSTRCPVCRAAPGERHAFPTCPGAAAERRTAAADQSVNLGSTRRLAGTSPVAPGGCDDCSVEPGERHRFPTCPGAVRAELRSIEREDLLLRVAGFANRIAADGLSPGLNQHVLQLLAESLLSLATDAYRPITGDDARCRLARAVLDALDVPR
jgi:hypothetical protein